MPKREQALGQGLQARHADRRPAPDEPASAGTQVDDSARRSKSADAKAGDRGRRPGQHRGLPRAPLRLPRAQEQRSTAPTSPASSTRCSRRRCPATRRFKGYLSDVLQASTRRRWSCEPLREGSKVIAGTVLGRIGKTDRARAAPPLLDPPGRPRGAEDRPEADPRRLEAARGDRDLPRRRQGPVRRTRRDRRPGAADVEGAADRAGARRPEPRDLRLRPRGHPDRPDRPPGPGDARVPRRPRLSASRSPR